MTIKAKPVLDDKFWIVEDGGVRVGTLSKNDEGFVISTKGNLKFYKTERQLKKELGKDLFVAKIKESSSSNESLDVNGYPTRSTPYNSMYDIKRKLPLFTKSEKSKSVYCAGYYLVKFNVNWLKSFCPKLITIERNEYLGPFKNEDDMKAALKNVNRAD